MLSEDTKNRLYNWKFDAALNQLDLQAEQETPGERRAVKALSEGYGNCGWFFGVAGELIAATVQLLIGDDYED